MKNFILMSVLVAVVSFSSPAAALESGRELGVGIVLGEPSGILGQFFMSHASLLDVTAAWSLDDWFMVAADYQIYNNLADAPPEWMWYYGLGGYVAFPENEDGIFGARVPLGISYSFPRSIVDVWVEIDPALQVLPDTEAELQGGIGLTIWLK